MRVHRSLVCLSVVSLLSVAVPARAQLSPKNAAGVEAFCRQLEVKGITLDQAFREVPAIGLKIADITDPSGVYVELTDGYDKY